MQSKRGLASQRIVLFSILMLAFSVVPHSSDSILLRIDRGEGIADAEGTLQDISVLQELDSCWIAETSWEQVDTLQRQGVACEILDPFPSGKAYYLLLGSASDQIHAIEPLGHVTAVEDQVWLFWSEGEDFWDLMPAQIQIKRLPEKTARRITLTAVQPAWEMSLQEEASPNLTVAKIVSEMEKENLTLRIQDLEDFRTRRAPTANLEAAGTYIYNFFKDQGIAVEYDAFAFTYQGATYPTNNIVATIPGRTAPEQIIIVGAHYDSTSDQAFTRAPGADDNASGSAAVMEIARIMSRHVFDRTVRFICFSAEELGLRGSQHYTQEAVQRGEIVRGMIDLDMIGYTTSSAQPLSLISNSPSEWLADLFVSCTATYTALPIIKSIRPSATGSDHSPFWDQGYSAVMGIEAYPLTNPYYHRTTDTLSTLNMDFAASVTGAALATTATLAQPVSTPSPPTAVTARSVATRSFLSRLKTVLVGWNSTDATVVGFNVYRSTALRAVYQKINSVPVNANSYADRFLEPMKTYYYMVTAVDGQGRESNGSSEVRDDGKN